MGLFSSKKKTVVSSQVYNLAGDKRENFLKGVIFNGVYMEDDPQLGTTIVNGITSTPAFKLRRLVYWLKKRRKGQRYLDIIGHQYLEFNSDLGTSGNALAQAFIATLTVPEHYNVNIDYIEISGADYWFWGAKYLAENYPQYADETLYDILMDFSYKNNKTITIHVYDLLQPNANYPDVEDNAYVEIDTIYYQAADYEKNVKALYAAYQIYPLVRQEDPVTHEVTYAEPSSITVPITYFIYKNVPSTHADYDSTYAAFFNIPTESGASTFLVPPIAFRLDNWQVSSAERSNADDWEFYQLTKTAGRKAFGDNKQYAKISGNILDSESIGDIDFAYLVFGVSINTKDKAGKQYAYNFMEALYRTYANSNYAIKEMYVTDREGRSRFSYKISWKSIAYGLATKGTDSCFSWMKKAFEESDKYAVIVHEGVQSSGKHTFFLRRTSKNARKIWYYEADDLCHHNYVADGKSVHTDADEAFDYEVVDGEEIYKESAFIFPLHEGLFRQLPVVAQAQISQSYAYLIFNCYKTKKVKWYQRGIFKIIAIAVVIVISVVITVLSWGTTAPEQGTFAATMIGTLTTAGLGTTAAMIITALVQNVASMIVGAIIAKLTTKGLAELGLDKTIAAIAGIVAGAFATAGMGGIMAGAANAGAGATGSITSSFTENALAGIYNFMTSPVKLLGLAASMMDAGTQMHLQSEAEKLQSRQKEIETLQGRTELLQQELSDMNTQFAEWARQLTLWKIQTSASPEAFMDIALASGSDWVERILRYPSIYLDVSTQLS